MAKGPQRRRVQITSDAIAGFAMEIALNKTWLVKKTDRRLFNWGKEERAMDSPGFEPGACARFAHATAPPVPSLQL